MIGLFSKMKSLDSSEPTIPAVPFLNSEPYINTVMSALPTPDPAVTKPPAS